MAAQLTEDDLLAAIARAIPDTYLEPIRALGDGYEMVRGFAAVGERTSQAVRRFELDGFITSAASAALAQVQVTFYRPDATAGAGTVLAGSLVRASSGGQVFRTTEDAVFGALTLSMTVAAVAMGYGYEWNVRGAFVDPDGNTWPGEIDSVDLPLQSPRFFDATIVVRNDTPASGGRPASLDTHGDERGLPRRPGEADYNYQGRIRTLADTVSPAAVIRQLTAYFKPFGLWWRAVETWQHEWQECFDAPAEAATIYENFDANLFCYDDPRPPSPMQNRWLGEIDYSGAFVVEIQAIPTVSDYAFTYDDPALSQSDLETALGTRALPAYDTPDPPTTIAAPSLCPVYDGVDFGASDLIVNVFTLLDQIKAAGVYVAVVIQELS